MKKFKIIFVLFILSQLTVAQEMTVTGIVRDSIGPFPGVNVIIKGTNRGTQTDFDGQYSIIAKRGEVLIFSYIGMKTQSITVLDTKINVKLYNLVIDPREDCDYFVNLNIIMKFERDKRPAIPSAKYLRQQKRDKNPRYNFRKNAKNKTYIIYFKNNLFCKSDYNFQGKFHVVYSLDRKRDEEYYVTNNRLVFKYLSKKFKKAWLEDIRKDAFGLNDFLK